MPFFVEPNKAQQGSTEPSTRVAHESQNATAEPTSNPTVAELTKVPELTKVGEVLIKRAKLINSVLADAHLCRNSMGGWYDDTGKFRWQSHTSKIVKDGYKASPWIYDMGCSVTKTTKQNPYKVGAKTPSKCQKCAPCTFWFREKVVLIPRKVAGQRSNQLCIRDIETLSCQA